MLLFLVRVGKFHPVSTFYVVTRSYSSRPYNRRWFLMAHSIQNDKIVTMSMVNRWSMTTLATNCLCKGPCNKVLISKTWTYYIRCAAWYCGLLPSNRSSYLGRRRHHWCDKEDQAFPLHVLHTASNRKLDGEKVLKWGTLSQPFFIFYFYYYYFFKIILFILVYWKWPS